MQIVRQASGEILVVSSFATNGREQFKHQLLQVILLQITYQQYQHVVR